MDLFDILDPEKKYHRWQLGHLKERVETDPNGPMYRVARIMLHHRFFIAGFARKHVDVDLRLLQLARDPERMFRREARIHAQALRLEAREIRREKILNWLTPHPIGVCRECGCTDDNACAGGCSWVDKRHTLCSRCAEGGHTDG